VTKQSKTYTHFLSDEDRITVRQVKDGNTILEFFVRYEALIDSRWRKITSYDNAHGYPHRHVYYPHRSEYIHAMNTINNNVAFTEAQIVIKKNFIRMKESYILSIRKEGGGEL